MIEEREVQPPPVHEASTLNPNKKIPRVAMSEVTPGCYWVLLNYPGRSAVTLYTGANLDVALAVMSTAELVSAEALCWAAEAWQGDTWEVCK